MEVVPDSTLDILQCAALSEDQAGAIFEQGRDAVVFALLEELIAITGEVLKDNPQILPTLRMATCPPLARDRLIGLADVSKNLVNRMEKKNSIPLEWTNRSLTRN